MITAKQIMIEIDEAIEQFGSYTYHDKGAYEVMDISAIVNELKTMSAEDIIKVLTEVSTSHKDPHNALSGIIGELDTWEDPRANFLFETELFQKYY